MTAPTYQSAGSFYEPSGTSIAGTHNIPYPATVNAGDRLVMAVAGAIQGNEAATMTSPPDGWDEIGDQILANQSGNDLNLWAFTKEADGTEDGGTEPITITCSSTNAALCAQIWRFLESAGVEDVLDDAPAGVPGTSVNGPTVTPAGVERVAVQILATHNDRACGNITGSSPINWTERTEDFNAARSLCTVQLQTADIDDDEISGGSMTLASGAEALAIKSFALQPDVVGPAARKIILTRPA